jgi:hypothetical protein
MRNPLASPRWWITGGFLLPVLLVGSAWLTTVIWPPEWSSDRTLTLAGQVSDDDDLFPATDPDFEPMRYASYRLTMQRNRNDSAYGYILMEVPPATLGLAKAALAHLSCRLARRAVQYPTQTGMRRFIIEYRRDPDDGTRRTVEATLDACRDP